ncbi:hypothetical protein ICN13_02055 [Polynucleobacter sp. MWH-Berg-3C6]|nr:hypothetical protein [Polynucleobacter sp. MWH-Berg-3C6]
MKKINICMVKPDDYIHSYAFIELGELIFFSLKELGYEVSIGFNNLTFNVKNILIGCHLLDPSYIKQVPKSTIIVNTEQIYNDTTSWNSNIFVWVKNFEVWDYSELNIEKLKSLGVDRVKLLKIGYQKELRRINMSTNKDIDVLFYGSINERRAEIINGLINRGLRVKTLFGVYGKERDEWIGRSQIVLNHHYYNSHIFEIVRVFYLLSNSIAVVGEVNDSTSISSLYKEGIYPSKYEDLVDSCLKLIKDNSLKQKIQFDAFNSISQYEQKFFTQQVIDF